jgi:DNA-binding NarL/FixJ family response regulator
MIRKSIDTKSAAQKRKPGKLIHRSKKASKIRVALFDDDEFFRQVMNIMFDGSEKMELCGTFENAVHATDNVKASSPDVVLMDIDMPGTSGIEALKSLKKKFPKLPVMMLTDHSKDELIIDAICAGANGYTLKATSSERIFENINDVFKGNGAFCAESARIVLRLFAQNILPVGNKVTYSLSVRELEVLRELVKGHAYKTIASNMGIGYDTVRAHIKSIYRKMKVGNTSGAVAKALKHRIVSH